MSPPSADPMFRTTRWTRVCLAKADSDNGRHALAELCGAYYEPVLQFLRRELRDADEARECAHEFFARTLAGGTIDTAEQHRGRFRFYLLGAVKHFLSHRREAASRGKRGGGAECIEINAAPEEFLPDTAQEGADEAFDREWALTTLARALQSLQEECAADGKLIMFEQMRPWLTGDAIHGDQERLAASLNLNTETLKSLVHRMRRRFRDLVKVEISSTLSEGASVDEEMHALLEVLRGR